jgi:hypothetical protein
MNSWRDADVVFLFDQFYLPKTVAVATVQGLRGIAPTKAIWRR